MAAIRARGLFGGPTVLEIGAYYVPWLDHALDVLATPSAVVAGVVMTASVVTGSTRCSSGRWRSSRAAVSRRPCRR
jgi:hypothetical protein